MQRCDLGGIRPAEAGIRRVEKVLFLPTGALLSKTSFNEGKSVPGIAHAVVLESPAVK